MKKIITILSVVSLCNIASASHMTNPEMIFSKKCAMCHTINKPKSKSEKMKMVAPPITMAMKSLTIGIDAIEDPQDKKLLRKMSIQFMKDYFNKPVRDDSYCEDKIFEKFNLMPSMNGFVKPSELDIVIPWVYDNFAPTQYR